MLDTLVQDFRYAIRNLRKTPGFTLIAALTLAVGIGTNTTMFSVVENILIRPFPFREPDRLAVIYEQQPKNDVTRASPSYQNFLDWQRDSRTTSAMAAQTMRSAVLTDGQEPVRLLGGVVSWNLFPTLGVDPILGRHFREDEDRPGAPGAVLIGYGLWKQRYNGDSTILGRVVQINTLPYTVVGVMPRGFRFPENQDIWITMAPIFHDTPRGARGFSVYARLAPGVTLAQATAEINGIEQRLVAAYPDANRDWEASVQDLAAAMLPDDVRLILLTMMGAVTFVLLIACANVANLLLARATARQREVAIRTALGAGRWRIVRQLLTESVIVALIGALGGALLAVWGTDLIWLGIPPDDLPYYIRWSVDVPTLVYTLAVAVTVGVVFGLAPALEATRGSLQETLKEGSRGAGTGGRRHRLRNALVVAEVALSLVLLVGSSLFVRSFLNALGESGGIDSGPLMTMRFFMPGQAYDSAGPKFRRVDDIVRRIEALPGVVAATASNTIPLSGGGNGDGIDVEGKPRLPGRQGSAFWTGVTAHWFKTLGVPMLRGRDFTEREAQDSQPVAILNRTMAERFWKGEDPVGRRFRFTGGDSVIGWITVIGVTPNIHVDEVDDDDAIGPAAYPPYPYLPTRNTGLTIRVAGNDPAAITADARQAIRAADPGFPVFEVATMEVVRRQGFWFLRLYGWMFGTFGAIALLLAAVGVYGVLAYNVAQRTQEIGVRMALGARGGDVLRLIVSQGVRLALLGVGIGLLAAFGVTRLLVSVLFQVSPSDPLSFGAVALFLAAIAALASWLPARRATRVDPLVALRYE
jgi:putative ABC transport system permease protein